MFDPYRKWLGIPEGNRPPTHYQLLGISPNERDAEVIHAAVVRQSAYVRNFQTGKYSAEATRLLNEIAAAKVCLLDPVKRARYDADHRNAAELPLPSTAGNPRRGRPAPAPAEALPMSQPEAWATPVAGPSAAIAAVKPPLESRETGLRSAVRPPVPAWNAPLPLPRSKAALPPLWLCCVLLGCCVPVALLGLAVFGRQRDADSLAAADRPDSSREQVLIHSGRYVPNRLENRGSPPAPPVSAPAEFPAGKDPLSSSGRPPLQVDMPLEPAAGVRPPEGGEPLLPPDQDFPESIDEFFDRMKEEVKRAGRHPQPPTGGPNHGWPAEPAGNWPMLDSDPRQPSKVEKKLQVKAARARVGPDRNRLLSPFAKDTFGRDTAFVGETEGGGPWRLVANIGYLIGVECREGSFGEPCIGDLLPIFSFERAGKYPHGAVARDGYAVGAVNVRSRTYVNAVQLIFMRIKDDGSLATDDSYTSEWIGFEIGQEQTLSGNGAAVIGIHKRQGLVVGCLALVVAGTAKPSGR